MKNLIEKVSNMPPSHYGMAFGIFVTIVGGLLCDFTKATATGIVLMMLGVAISVASAIVNADRQY